MKRRQGSDLLPPLPTLSSNGNENLEGSGRSRLNSPSRLSIGLLRLVGRVAEGITRQLAGARSRCGRQRMAGGEGDSDNKRGRRPRFRCGQTLPNFNLFQGAVVAIDR
jgi:hypothetical protein